ncbi:hypothetical protein L9F63_026220, partial [Diploptera punctata]
ISEDEVLGQALLFFVAGSETTATTIAFALYELAVQEDIQMRLRSEIRNVLEHHKGKVTYEAVQDMKYLHMVVSGYVKTITLIFHNRMSLHDYCVPGTNLVIERGTPVYVSLLGLHRDPAYHDNPLKFDPERFSKDKNCVGLRLALLSVKVMLVVLLQIFRVVLDEKTPVPLVLSPYVLFLKNIGQLPLQFVPDVHI